MDLLRSTAIGLVLAAHSLAVLPSGTWEHLPLAKAGFFGVELFFVLSGFLIGGILIRQIETSPLTPRSIFDFWRRRWIRTIPNYLLFLMLAIFVEVLVHRATMPSWKYFIFSQNLAWAPPPHMPESWSLAVEEWFYLLCPIILGGISAVSGKIRTWHLALILLALTMPRFVFLYANFGIDIDWDSQIKKVVIFRLDAIFFGVFVAWIYAKRRAEVEHYSIPAFLIGCALIVCSAFIVSREYSVELSAAQKILRGGAIFSITSLGYALTIPLALRYRSPSNSLAVFVAAFSKISYSLYLAHLSLALPISVRIFRESDVAYSILAFLGLSIGISTVIFLYFEHPITSLRERWKIRHKG
ncbi:MAG TPA: acyltransferase [Synechococcales cyanobacterium M55_K2018_004]|nr:acyltransferase [Synechococcales cyanobacterium M55_K2018_004]